VMDDCQLVNTSAESSNSEMVFGSEEDESNAQAFLSAINKDDVELIETVMSHFKKKSEYLPEKFNGIEEQLLQEFSLDDSFPLGAPLFMETPHYCSMYAEKDDHCFDEDGVPSELDDDDDDIIFEHSGSQSDRKTSGSMASSDVLTVNQLIESVHETARQVANVPVSANPVPYDQMKSQCEALVMEKQQKMSVLLSFKHSRADSHGSTRVDGLEMNEACISSKYSHHTYHSFRFQICFFSREENAVQILTSLSSIVMCCSHPCDQSLRCNQLGRGACAAAIHYPANLTVRSGCHLQAHTTSS